MPLTEEQLAALAELSQTQRKETLADSDAVSTKDIVDGDSWKVGGESKRDSHTDTAERFQTQKGDPGVIGLTQSALVKDLADTGRLRSHSSGEYGSGGRELSSLVDDQGNNISRELIRQGLADPSPYNQDLSDQLAHHRAKLERRTAELNGLDPGYSGLNDDLLGVDTTEYHHAISEEEDRLHGASAIDRIGSTFSRGDRRGFVEKNIDGGIDEFQMMFGGAARVIGAGLGIEGVEEYGTEVMIRNMREASYSPAEVSSLDELEWTNAHIFIAETLLREAPSAALDLGIGVATGGGSLVLTSSARMAVKKIGRELVEESVARGGGMAVSRDLTARFSKSGVTKLDGDFSDYQGIADRMATQSGMKGLKVGGSASMLGQNIGEAEVTAFNAGIDTTQDQGAAARVIAGGMAATALDVILPATVLKRLESKSGLKRESIKAVAKDVALQGVAKGGTMEGVTEALQQAVHVLNARDMAGTELWKEDDWKEYLFAAMQGATAGGGLAGGAETLSGIANLERPSQQTVTAEEPNAQIENQVDDLIDGNTPRQAVVISTAGDGKVKAERAKQRAEAAGTPLDLVDRGDASVLVRQDAPAEVKEMAADPNNDHKILGYGQSKEEALANNDPVAVVTSNKNGMLSDEASDRSVAEARAAEIEASGPYKAEVREATDVMAERAQAVAAEVDDEPELFSGPFHTKLEQVAPEKIEKIEPVAIEPEPTASAEPQLEPQPQPEKNKIEAVRESLAARGIKFTGTDIELRKIVGDFERAKGGTQQDKPAPLEPTKMEKSAKQGEDPAPAYRPVREAPETTASPEPMRGVGEQAQYEERRRAEKAARKTEQQAARQAAISKRQAARQDADDREAAQKASEMGPKESRPEEIELGHGVTTEAASEFRTLAADPDEPLSRVMAIRDVSQVSATTTKRVGMLASAKNFAKRLDTEELKAALKRFGEKPAIEHHGVMAAQLRRAMGKRYGMTVSDRDPYSTLLKAVEEKKAQDKDKAPDNSAVKAELADEYSRSFLTQAQSDEEEVLQASQRIRAFFTMFAQLSSDVVGQSLTQKQREILHRVEALEQETESEKAKAKVKKLIEQLERLRMKGEGDSAEAKAKQQQLREHANLHGALKALRDSKDYEHARRRRDNPTYKQQQAVPQSVYKEFKALRDGGKRLYDVARYQLYRKAMSSDHPQQGLFETEWEEGEVEMFEFLDQVKTDFTLVARSALNKADRDRLSLQDRLSQVFLDEDEMESAKEVFYKSMEERQKEAERTGEDQEAPETAESVSYHDLKGVGVVNDLAGLMDLVLPKGVDESLAKSYQFLRFLDLLAHEATGSVGKAGLGPLRQLITKRGDFKGDIPKENSVAERIIRENAIAMEEALVVNDVAQALKAFDAVQNQLRTMKDVTKSEMGAQWAEMRAKLKEAFITSDDLVTERANRLQDVNLRPMLMSIDPMRAMDKFVNDPDGVRMFVDYIDDVRAEEVSEGKVAASHGNAIKMGSQAYTFDDAPLELARSLVIKAAKAAMTNIEKHFAAADGKSKFEIPPLADDEFVVKVPRSKDGLSALSALGNIQHGVRTRAKKLAEERLGGTPDWNDPATKKAFNALVDEYEDVALAEMLGGELRVSATEITKIGMQLALESGRNHVHSDGNHAHGAGNQHHGEVDLTRVGDAFHQGLILLMEAGVITGTQIKELTDPNGKHKFLRLYKGVIEGQRVQVGSETHKDKSGKSIEVPIYEQQNALTQVTLLDVATHRARIAKARGMLSTKDEDTDTVESARNALERTRQKLLAELKKLREELREKQLTGEDVTASEEGQTLLASIAAAEMYALKDLDTVGDIIFGVTPSAEEGNGREMPQVDYANYIMDDALAALKLADDIIYSKAGKDAETKADAKAYADKLRMQALKVRDELKRHSVPKDLQTYEDMRSKVFAGNVFEFAPSEAFPNDTIDNLRSKYKKQRRVLMQRKRDMEEARHAEGVDLPDYVQNQDSPYAMLEALGASAGKVGLDDNRPEELQLAGDAGAPKMAAPKRPGSEPEKALQQLETRFKRAIGNLGKSFDTAAILRVRKNIRLVDADNLKGINQKLRARLLDALKKAGGRGVAVTEDGVTYAVVGRARAFRDTYGDSAGSVRTFVALHELAHGIVTQFNMAALSKSDLKALQQEVPEYANESVESFEEWLADQIVHVVQPAITQAAQKDEEKSLQEERKQRMFIGEGIYMDEETGATSMSTDHDDRVDTVNRQIRNAKGINKAIEATRNALRFIKDMFQELMQIPALADARHRFETTELAKEKVTKAIADAMLKAPGPVKDVIRGFDGEATPTPEGRKLNARFTKLGRAVRKGVLKLASTRMQIASITDKIDPSFASLFEHAAGTDVNGGMRGLFEAQYGESNTHIHEFATATEDLNDKDRKAALKDGVYYGGTTDNGKRVRAWLDRFNKNYLQGYGGMHRKDGAPIVFDLRMLRDQPERFHSFTKRQMKISQADSEAVLHNLIKHKGSMAFLPAYGLETKTIKALEDTKAEVFIGSGLLVEDTQEALHHYIISAVTRVEHAKRLGDVYGEPMNAKNVVNKFKQPISILLRQGKIRRVEGKPGLFQAYDPDAKIKQMLDRLNPYDSARLKIVIEAALGRRGQEMGDGWKTTQSWVLAVLAMPMLLHTVAASFVELGTIPLKAGDMQGMIRAMGQMGKALTSPRAVMEHARAMGVIETGVSQAVVNQVYGLEYMNKTPRKMLNFFFTYNGQRFFTDFSRSVSAFVAQDFVKQHVRVNNSQSNHYMADLGLESVADRTAVSNWMSHARFGEGPTMELKETDPEAYQGAVLYATAVNRFTSMSTVLPSQGTNAPFMNDPRFSLLSFLLPFQYAVFSKVFGGMQKEMKRRYDAHDYHGMKELNASLPLIAASLFLLPLAAMGAEFRDWVNNGFQEGDSAYSKLQDHRKLWYLIRRTGALGPVERTLAFTEESWRGNQFVNFAGGPLISQILKLTDELSEGSETDLGKVLRKVLPVYSQVKPVRKTVDDFLGLN